MKQTHLALASWALASLMIAVAGGCSGGAKFAPVSGVVKVNGKPYGKALVSFQPMATDGNPNPGRGSSAYTDGGGRFTLMSDGTQDGAIVGKHIIRIRSVDKVVEELVSEPSPDDAPAPRMIDPIPPEWNEQSNKEFEVPPEGTDQANFDIVTKR